MGCTRQYTKKYRIRGSPPYPANECRNARKKGNDGRWYRSTAASNGVCRWVVEKGQNKKPTTSRVVSKETGKLKKGGYYMLTYRRPAVKVFVYYIGTFKGDVSFSMDKGGESEYELVKHGKTYYNARDMSKVGVTAV